MRAALLLGCAILTPGVARASLPVDVTVPAQLLKALQNLGCTPIQACVDAVAEGLGSAVRSLGMSQGAGPSGWASREAARSIGQQVAGRPLPWSSIFQNLPPNLRGPQLLQSLRGGANYVTSVQGALSRSQLLQLNTLAAEAQNAARVVQTGVAATEGAAEGTWGSWIRSIGEGAKARFGGAMAMEFTSIAARFVAGGIIAGVAGAAIYESLRAYQDMAASLADEAEANAYNNDVRLMLDAIRSGRQELATGLTLGAALIRLRENLAGGGRHFEGIFKARPEEVVVVPPGQGVFVYFNVNQFTCCAEGGAPAPHPIQVGPVRQWAANLRRLAGPFDSKAEAIGWICAGRVVYPHGPEGTWARFGSTILTRVPCRVTVR